MRGRPNCRLARSEAMSCCTPTAEGCCTGEQQPGKQREHRNAQDPQHRDVLGIRSELSGTQPRGSLYGGFDLRIRGANDRKAGQPCFGGADLPIELGGTIGRSLFLDRGRKFSDALAAVLADFAAFLFASGSCSIHRRLGGWDKRQGGTVYT